MNQPKNYQSSSYAAQAAEFERQHGNIGTPEHVAATTPDPYLLKHAYDYAHGFQDMLEDEALAYAAWYVENFPEGDVAHSNPYAFFAWIRIADTRYRGCYPSIPAGQS